jgi:hypothetical protein
LKSALIGLYARETAIQKQCEGLALNSDYSLLVLHWIEENHNFPKRKPKWDLAKLDAQRWKCNILYKNNSVQSNVKVQRNNIKKCVLDSVSDLAWKVDRKARKPLITQEMISEMGLRK